jgi:hypothetical protein
MSLLRDPIDWDRPDRANTREPYVPFKQSRPAQPVLGRGSLACPSCDVPVVASGAISLLSRLRCPFCRAIHPARAFLRLGRPDTELNEVQVTARIGIR